MRERPDTAGEQHLLVLQGIAGALEHIQIQLGLLAQQLQGALGTDEALSVRYLLALREHTRMLITLLDDLLAQKETP